MDASAEAGAAPAVVFKRKRGPASRAPSSNTAASSPSSSSIANSQAGPSRSTRNRADSDSSGSDSESRSAVVIKKKRSNNNPLVQSTGAVLRRSKLSSSLHSDDEYSLDSNAQSAQQASASTNGSSTVSSLQKIREDATRHSDWDLSEPSSSLKEAPAASNADGLYRGAKSYTSYIAARDDGSSSKMRSRGPIRQTTTVRTTSLMDYQPDVCKDYKETGYCGFGDTCKFLHDRSDYLAGWQLDVLPNSSARGRENLLSDPEDDEQEEDEQVPFACLICRQPFTDPVVTRCGHYFCSGCAIKRFAKNSKCFACGQQTGGLFNSAQKVLDKMQRARELKAEVKREKRGWLVEEQSVPIRELGTDSDDE